MFESINELMSEYNDKVAAIEDIMIQQERTIEYAAIQEDLDLLLASRDVVAMLEACDNKIPNEAAAKYLVGFMQAHNLMESGEVSTHMVIESIGETLGKFWDKIGEILQKIWDFFFKKAETSPVATTTKAKAAAETAKAEVDKIVASPNIADNLTPVNKPAAQPGQAPTPAGPSAPPADAAVKEFVALATKFSQAADRIGAITKDGVDKAIALIKQNSTEENVSKLAAIGPQGGLTKEQYEELMDLNSTATKAAEKLSAFKIDSKNNLKAIVDVGVICADAAAKFAATVEPSFKNELAAAKELAAKAKTWKTPEAKKLGSQISSTLVKSVNAELKAFTSQSKLNNLTKRSIDKVINPLKRFL